MNSRRPVMAAQKQPLQASSFLLALLLGSALLVGPAARADDSADAGLADAVTDSIATIVQEGLVSWYGAAFHQRPTASGELFDAGALTMAHRHLPFGTRVRVTNLRNGRSVVVRVNDRGPFVGKRIADLSHAAAAKLGMLSKGIVRARIEVLGK